MARADSFKSSLSPAEHLILNCLRTGLSGGAGGFTVEACPSLIEWDAVLETAWAWNVAPMVYRILSRHQGIRNGLMVPETVSRSLAAAYTKTLVVNQANFLELTKLVQTLASAGIRVILLKGAHLAPFVYRDLGMRWMADVDLLIRREDLQKADRLLLEAGYGYGDQDTTVWDDFGKERVLPDRGAVIEWYKNHHMHLGYSHNRAIPSLELHWGIVKRESPFAVDTEGLWERARQQDINGQTAWVLSPEDLLLHIALHDAYYHRLRLFGLRPCCDMAVAVRSFSKEIDWDILQARARDWGVEKYLHLMVGLSRELIGADIPMDMPKPVGLAGCNEAVIRQAEERILKKESYGPRYRGMKHPLQIGLLRPRRGFLETVRFFLKRIHIPSEELASRYAVPSYSKKIPVLGLLRIASVLFAYGETYGAYLWERIRYGRHSAAEHNLDIWLTRPGIGERGAASPER